MSRVYLSLGSNLGDRLDNLRHAIELFAPDVRISKRSSVYETVPVGVGAQPEFLNMVVEGETDLDPTALLGRLQQVEHTLGRAPNTHNQPRPVDIDILLYDDQQLSLLGSVFLVIPHPSMHERAFVLVPLAEIAPDVRDPKTGQTARQMLAALGDTSGVKRSDPQL